MIQVQNGRLHYNWTGYLGGEYPRYTAIKPEFQDCWGRFQEFIKSEELGVPSPNQWEITYVNQIDKETLWTGPQDWGDVLTLLAATPQTSMVELANLSAKWHFEMPGQRGRLHVQVDLGRRADPSGHPKEVIVLQLTARGPIRGDVSLEHGLDIGREAIVRTFADITSVKAHQFWRKTDVAP
jgi:uncharacterized protein (TIGR04255 family)